MIGKRITPSEWETLLYNVEYAMSDWLSQETIDNALEKATQPALKRVWDKLFNLAESEHEFCELFYLCCENMAVFESNINWGKRLKDKSEALETLQYDLKKFRAKSKFADLSYNDVALEGNRLIYLSKTENWLENIIPDGKVSLESHNEIYFDYLIEDMLFAIQKYHSNLIKDLEQRPLNKAITNKKGASGQTAFFTNRLAEVTNNGFSRPCYVELATIANHMLDTNPENPVSADTVRVNYANYCKRNISKK